MEQKILNIQEIKEIIPHRYPFLLVDRIIEVEPMDRAVGIKNVTGNEEFFRGHFPDYPVMPGVLVLEALAQTACVCGMIAEENRNKIPLFTGMDGIKIRKQVQPGDVLRLEAVFGSFRHGMGKVDVKATVEGKTAVEGTIKFAMVEKN